MIGLLIRNGHADAATRLVEALTWANLAAVYSSPLGRAIDTARPLARDHGLNLTVRPGLTDIDSGEAREEVQQRIVRELMTLSTSHPGEVVALVTHAEPIRCALAAFGLGTLADVLAVDITPTHISAIGFEPTVSRVLGVDMPADLMAV